MDKAAFANTLAQFTGTDGYVRHGMMRNMLMTDGVTWLTENGCAWLVDIVASYQGSAHIKQQSFQCWRLVVDLNARAGVVVMDDGNGKEFVRQLIPFTDCPVGELKLYLIEEGDQWVCMVASEY